MKTEVEPTPIGRGLQFAEGINFDRDGTLYCVDVSGGAIWRLAPGGPLQEWVPTGGNPNGSRFGPGGDLFVADCGRKAILRISTATGHSVTYADHWEQQHFQGPNDLCFGPDGRLFFTDPAGSSLSRRIGAVYAVNPAGNVTRLVTGLAFPNGIAVTPDGTTLIVGETFTGALRRFRLTADHDLEEMEPLAVLTPAGEGADEAGPDGMAFGDDGLLYVAHYGGGLIQAIAPDGTLVAGLPAGGPSPTNVAFWEKSLYITEGKTGTLYRLDIGVGEQPPFARPW